MKEVTIKSKIVGRGGASAATSPGKGVSVDMSGYLLKQIWEKVFEFRLTDDGTEYLFAKMDMAVQGGITMYADGGNLNLKGIYDGLPIDNDTIYWDGTVLRSRGVGEGGVTPTLIGDLKNVGSWANSIATEDRIMVQKKDSSSWEALELSKIGGSASFENVKESGAGNAYTSFILSEDKKSLTFLKGKVFAEKSNSLSGYGIADAKIANGVITLGSNTITPLTQVLGDARYVTALGTSGNDLTWTKNGLINKITVPYAKHSAYLRNYLGDYNSITDLDAPSTFEDGQYRVVYDYYNRNASNKPVTQNNANGVLTFFKGIHVTGGGQYMSQLAFPDKDAVYFRRASDGVFGDWKQIAFTDSDITGNAGTATALKDRRSLWGQWFDGKDNVSGDMTGVGSVTMDGQLSLDGITIRKSADGVLFVDGNLVVRGGVTMYGTDGTTAPLIWDDAPIANTNGKKGVASYDPNFFSVNNGVVTFVGQTGGGVADSVAWGDIDGKPGWITDAKPRYQYTEIEGTPDLSVYALKTSLDNYQTKITSSNKLPYSLVDGTPDLSGYITKGTSLSHYGITNAYTKTEVDNNFVAKTTKDFMKVNGSLTSNVDFNNFYTSGSYNNTTGNGSGNSNAPATYGLMLVFGDKSGYAAQLHVNSDNTSVKVRTRYMSGGSFSWKSWEELAYTTSNVASATKLKTPRKIWGQDFDGTDDVSGAIKNATTGSFSGDVSMGSATINGGKLTYDSTYKYWKLEGDLLVTGGVTMFGNDSAFSPSTITQAVNVDGTTIINDGKKLMLNPDIQLGGGGVTDYNDLTGKPDLSVYALKTSLSSYQTKITSTNKLDYGLISGTPTIPTNTNQLTNGAGFITSSGSITGNAATATTASKLSTVSKTAWGQTYWTSGGVPTTISGNISSVGNITSLANGTYDIGSSSNKWKDLWVGNVKYTSDIFLGFTSSYFAVRVGGTGSQLIVDSTSVRTNSTTAARATLGTSGVPWKGLYLGADSSAANNKYGVNFSDANGNTVARLAASGALFGLYAKGGIRLRGGCTSGIDDMTASGTGVEIDASGNMLVTGGVTMYSDVRKKTILNHVELSLKEVADAPLIEHYYNSDESKRTHVGSVAQYWAGLNDWFCKEDEEGFLTMEIQNAALASAISVARELTRYESKTDKQIKKLKKRIGELEEEIENLKKV